MGAVADYVNFIRSNGSIYRFVVPFFKHFLIKSQQPTSNTPLDVQVDTGDGTGYWSRFRVENNNASGLTDVNVRASVLNIGNWDTGVDKSGTKIVMEHVTGDSANFIEIYKPGTGLGGTGAHTAQIIWRVNQAGTVVLGVGGIATNAMVIQNTDGTEGGSRWIIDEHGKQTWGTGTGAGDTILERASADVLHTADRFVADDGITIKTKAGAISDADFAHTPPDGTIGINTSAPSIMVRIGGVWKSAALV